MDFNHMSDQNIMAVLGARFRAARLNKNLSAVELAERAGITSRTITNIETGKKSASTATLISLLRALGQLDELNNFMPEPPPKAASMIKQAKLAGRRRQRASPKASKVVAGKKLNKPFKWGDEK